jgi:nitrogen fixation NifU-like protein
MSDFDNKLLSYFLNPKNVGLIDNPNGYGTAENPINGYRTDIYIKVENEIIKDIKFKTIGCTVTIASDSALTEIVKGKKIKEIINNENPLRILLNLITNELGSVPEKNWHCPPTAIQVLFYAILDYYKKIDDNINIKKVEKIIDEIKKYFKKTINEK